MMCAVSGISRSAYYKRNRRESVVENREGVVLKLVKGVRKEQPRVGGRKLHKDIGPELKESGIACGRDKLFEILRRKGMLVAKKKRFQKTTYPNHSYAVAPNRFKEMDITKPKEAVVSDITYITLQRGFAYLFLVTDAFSRKILGFHLSKDLSHHSALLALDMALSGIQNPAGIVHHSDRGVQYCCHEFLKYLSAHGGTASMTDESHCYQNAIAERVNGILKDEFDLDAVYESFVHANEAVRRAVRIYNTKRRHWSLGLKTPQEVHDLAA